MTKRAVRLEMTVEFATEDGHEDPMYLWRDIELSFAPVSGGKLSLEIDGEEYEVIHVTCVLPSESIRCLVKQWGLGEFESDKGALAWAKSNDWTRWEGRSED